MFYSMINFYILLRKFRSVMLLCNKFIITFKVYFSVFGNPAITIQKNCHFGRSVRLLATDGGSIFIGQRSYLGDHVQIVVQGGKITIEDDVFIGVGSIVVSNKNIFIGKDTLIAEYVVIRDQDHRTDSNPVRLSGFHSSPIQIGRDTWIGCKATLLRGATVGDRCVIGAHALVKSPIPDDMLAVGVPARAIRRLEKVH